MAEFYLDEMNCQCDRLLNQVNGNGSTPTTSLQIAMRFGAIGLLGKQQSRIWALHQPIGAAVLPLKACWDCPKIS